MKLCRKPIIPHMKVLWLVIFKLSNHIYFLVDINDLWSDRSFSANVCLLWTEKWKKIIKLKTLTFLKYICDTILFLKACWNRAKATRKFIASWRPSNNLQIILVLLINTWSKSFYMYNILECNLASWFNGKCNI